MIVAISQIGGGEEKKKKKKNRRKPPTPPTSGHGSRSAAAAIIRRLDTLLKRRLVGGAYPSGSRSRSDVSPAHTVRDRSVLLSPPDGFRLGKHTDVASSLAGRAYRLPRDIHHRIIARPCSRAVRTCRFSLSLSLCLSLSVSALHKAAKACMCKRPECRM